MAIDRRLDYNGNAREDLEKFLETFDAQYDAQFEQYTINFLGKWIWIFNYEDEKPPGIMIEFSHDFREEPDEIKQFVDKLLALGFTEDEWEPE